MRVVAWFSCGAASAVATKIAIKEYGIENVDIVYQDTGSEHEDNKRFLRECGDWFGKPVTVVKSDTYSDTWDVFEKTRWLVGVGGARCTVELKKIPARKYMDGESYVEVLGYTVDEQSRAERFMRQNPERKLRAILIERGLTKGDCLAMVDRAGIELPQMYKLGYLNNNCIGCVKGQMGYWNKIRVDFPAVFGRMAGLERKLDVAICKSYAGDGDRKRVFLDELDPAAGIYESEPSISCGVICEIESMSIEEA